MDPQVSRIIRDIKGLKIQGAREIAKAGLRAVEIEARRSRARTAKAFVSDIEKTAMNVSRSRPTEPGLRHMLSSILLRVKSFETKDVKKLRSFTQRAVDGLLEELEGALDRIAENGANLIRSGDMILTHCHSHSVVAILRRARAQGKKFKVIVTETRPLYQGVMTAKDLLKSKIPILYSEDSAIGHFMKVTTKVLVGCDAILPNGAIVNKIGTLPLAIVAKHFGRPVFVAGGTIKITPEVQIEFRKAEEIIEPQRLPGAKIINPAFDVTPAEFIDQIITEKGVVKPQMIDRLLARETASFSS